MRLCAASRPVRSLPDEQQALARLPGGDFFAGQAIERHAARAAHPASSATFGHCDRSGGDEHRGSGPIEREMRVTRGGAVRDDGHRQRGGMRRVVEHLHIEHRGEAAEPLRTDAEVVDAAINLDAQLLERGSTVRAREARACRWDPSATSWRAAWPSRRCRRCRRRACPADTSPPPSRAPLSTTQSATESDGFSMANMDLFSEPPPLAATVISTRSPGTSSVWITAGVLSRVPARLPAGSATMEARSLLSGSR